MDNFERFLRPNYLEKAVSDTEPHHLDGETLPLSTEQQPNAAQYVSQEDYALQHSSASEENNDNNIEGKQHVLETHLNQPLTLNEESHKRIDESHPYDNQQDMTDAPRDDMINNDVPEVIPIQESTNQNLITSPHQAGIPIYSDMKSEEIGHQQLTNICAPLQYQARFQCNKCPRKFSLKAHLINHQKTHEDPMSFYECDICRKMFQGRKSLNRHKLMHNENRKHECDFCHRKFYCIDHLKVHIRVHTGEKPHQCNVCGKRFSQSGTLSRHKMIHSGLRPHGCNLCNVGFKTKIELQKHMERLHLTGEHTEEKTEYPDSDGTGGHESPNKSVIAPPMYTSGGPLPPISMISPFFPNPYLLNMFSHHASAMKDMSSLHSMPAQYGGPMNLKVETIDPREHLGVSSSDRRESSESLGSQDNPHEVNLPATSSTLAMSTLNDPGTVNLPAHMRHSIFSPSAKGRHDSDNPNTRAALGSNRVLMSPPQHGTRHSPDIISTGSRSSIEVLPDRGNGIHHYPADSSIDSAMITASKRILECPVDELIMYLMTSPHAHKCEHCQIVFADSAMYYIHRGMHTSDDPFKCNICGKNANNKYDFMAHHHNY